jgi:fumarate reductase subunit C
LIMAGAAHPEAMAPAKKGLTRTAPPQTPSTWWGAPRIRIYLLFGSTGLVYMLAGGVVWHLAWALGKGPDAWENALRGLSNPLYIGFHLITLVSLLFVGVRAFGTMMPKMQPRGGPLPVLAPGVVRGVIYGAWLAISLVLSAILAGGIF